MTAILTATARTREWLEATATMRRCRRSAGSRSSARSPAVAMPDGSERGVDACRTTDGRRVRASREAAMRRLGWLRDGHRPRRRGRRPARAGRPPAGRTGDGDRSAAAMLRHVAGAAAWYVERLGGRRRYGGPPDGRRRRRARSGRRLGHRAARVRSASDDGREVAAARRDVDARQGRPRDSCTTGSTTCWELERRLARADGTRRARRGQAAIGGPARTSMAALLRSVGWDARAADAEAFGRAIAGTAEFARRLGRRPARRDRALAHGRRARRAASPRSSSTRATRARDRRAADAPLMDGRDGMRFALRPRPAWTRGTRSSGSCRPARDGAAPPDAAIGRHVPWRRLRHDASPRPPSRRAAPVVDGPRPLAASPAAVEPARRRRRPRVRRQGRPGRRRSPRTSPSSATSPAPARTDEIVESARLRPSQLGDRGPGVDSQQVLDAMTIDTVEGHRRPADHRPATPRPSRSPGSMKMTVDAAKMQADRQGRCSRRRACPPTTRRSTR